jgi:hypothetical protein
MGNLDSFDSQKLTLSSTFLTTAFLASFGVSTALDTLVVSWNV